MLTLYRETHCPVSDEVQQQLQELTLAHRVVYVDDPSLPAAAALPPGSKPPLLGDHGQLYVGGEAIARHLEQLGEVKARWDRFGADACYCDGDGEVL